MMGTFHFYPDFAFLSLLPSFCSLPYHHNLIALRNVISQIPEEMWNSSFYLQWLRLLQCLSHEQSSSPKYPDCFLFGWFF